MNERIEELAVKSGFELEDGGHLMLHHLYVTNRLEKFAELIVEECMNATRGASTGLDAFNNIKEHFGVE